MRDIPWRNAIDRALTMHDGAPASRWVQLATVGLDGRPHVRTVVYRGFLGDGSTLRFTSDARSEKIVDLARDDRAEVCWMFPETREQFRIAGRVRVIGEGHPDEGPRADREEAWSALPPKSRLPFAWPDPAAPKAEARRFRVDEPDPGHPPSWFVLLLLDPDRVDHLDLRTDPHARIRYDRADGGGPSAWSAAEVNP